MHGLSHLQYGEAHLQCSPSPQPTAIVPNEIFMRPQKIPQFLLRCNKVGQIHLRRVDTVEEMAVIFHLACGDMQCVDYDRNDERSGLPNSVTGNVPRKKGGKELAPISTRDC